VDGEFTTHTSLNLQEFLSEQGDLLGNLGRWGAKATRALKHFLRKRGYSSEDCGVRACRECSRWASSAVPRTSGVTPAEALATARRAMTTALRDPLLCRLDSENADQDSFRPNGPRNEWARGLQAWLRDEGFPLPSASASPRSGSSTATWPGQRPEGDGLWDEDTNMALQQFLNSTRATTIVTSAALVVDGDFSVSTITRLREFLAHRGGSPDLVSGEWDSMGKSALQRFLWQRGHYAGMVDGTFESLSVTSMRNWLEYEGFSTRELDTLGLPTKALQRFLNSARASVVELRSDVP